MALCEANTNQSQWDHFYKNFGAGNGINFVYFYSSKTWFSLSFYESFVQILSVVNLSYNETIIHIRRKILVTWRESHPGCSHFHHLGMGRIILQKGVPVPLTREVFQISSLC